MDFCFYLYYFFEGGKDGEDFTAVDLVNVFQCKVKQHVWSERLVFNSFKSQLVFDLTDQLLGTLQKFRSQMVTIERFYQRKTFKILFTPEESFNAFSDYITLLNYIN